MTVRKPSAPEDSAGRPARLWNIVGAVALVLVVVATFAFSRAFASTPPTTGQVAEALTCQCGCNRTVASCNMPTCEFSVPVRGQIASMIAHGKSQVEIVAFYRHKYGEKILSAPTTHGFDLFAWTMPFAALLIGGVVVVFTTRRWRRAPAAAVEAIAAAASADSSGASEFDPELRARLAEDLRKGG